MTEHNDASIHVWDTMESDRPLDHILRKRIIGTHAMISHVTLERGFVVPTHQHENEQFVCVLSGRATFGIGPEGSPDRREETLVGGQVLHLPPNVPHSCTASETTVILDVFSPPSETTGVDAASK